MSPEQETYLLIKGTIADLPETDRQRVESAAQALRDVANAAGVHGNLALALVGAEAAKG